MGSSDAQNTFSEFFGKDRLLEAIHASMGMGAQDTVDLILDRVSAFAHGAPISDDRTLLVIRV